MFPKSIQRIFLYITFMNQQIYTKIFQHRIFLYQWSKLFFSIDQTIIKKPNQLIARLFASQYGYIHTSISQIHSFIFVS